MKPIIILAIGALFCLMACDATDERAELLVDDLHEVINEAEQKIENPTTTSDWEPIEKDFQALATEARELRPQLEYPIQLRLDSLINYFEASRQAYLDRVPQVQSQSARESTGTNQGSATDTSNTVTDSTQTM